LKFRVFLCSALFSLSAMAEPWTAADSILENYVTATQLQAVQTRGASMDADFDVTLPKLKKHGKLHALRHLSPLGLIRYEKPKFEGDAVVYKEVIARFLNEEVEAQRQQSAAVAVTPANYNSKYKGTRQDGDRPVHVFEITPKQKREKLFKGEVWIDATTYLKVQESGYMVKNPSMMVKKIAFVRRYEIRDGVAVPRKVESVTDVRLVGKAEMTIDYSNFAVEEDQTRASADAAWQ